MAYTIGAAAIFILTVAALVDCWGTERRLRAKAVWTLAILAFPLLGTLVWFALGHRWRKARAVEPRERATPHDDATGEAAPQPI